ncbi:magnesium-dependent phosphatase 1-like [Haliotis rubra]|uniref:magnesium-dependent phosphatase 1-like n=1 Tax=Haliotis rubra TaxID=36100 RepID=UPI001EE5FE35|nr:magnesium-dependent phosphatase 1-like [Haliotis rubra]XP_046570795.1 magnesium-dependent phosphatase 1-like [Haliotis rubra]XP_046570796.1 magnesium-dependent phosphatase 1-like [Haliotis rubra]XP_046570797.1 magnesium-dependent phosphatase 1-like [Haliotis rubra]
MARPRLIVFDLDYTLWPFWVDSHHDPPFVKRCDGRVYDRQGQVVSFYPDVPRVLQRLHSEGYMLAVASRSRTPPEAHELCHLFDWDRYFTYKEIYPGSKVKHFGRFTMASGIPYEDMLFFDDEQRNIIELRSIGVTSILVSDGVTESLIKEGLETFQFNRQQHG